MNPILKTILTLALIALISAVKANSPEEKSNENNNTQIPEDSLYMPLQISFVPNFGTCGFHTDKLTTNVSINILVGRIYSVRSTEIGGIINIVQNYAGQCQLAGVGNVVHGTSSGFQGAGILNHVNNLNGIQVAGITNNANKAYGMQIAGIVNHTTKGKCSQLSGIINSSNEAANFQIGGLVNSAPEVDIFQLGGLVNNCRHTRFQISGLVNQSKKTDLFQMAGLVNNTSEVTGFQIAGLVNKAPEIKSIQVSGLVNRADNVSGSQVSGLINHAKCVRGVQVGVINIADTCKGLMIGVINLAKNGYHTIEVSGDELLYTHVAFRSGTEIFHGIITAGVKPDDLINPEWMYGGGFGSMHNLGKSTRFGMDMMFQHLLKNDIAEHNFLYTFGTGIDQRISRKISIYCGATFNVLSSKTNQWQYSEIYSSLPPYHLFEGEHDNYTYKAWVGGKIALRFF